MASRLPIPRILWESLETALTAKIHKLAKDIAITIGEDVRPLMNALTKEKMSVYLVDQADIEEDISEFRCPCGAPILWSTATQVKKRCPEHVGSERIAIDDLHFLDEDGSIVDSVGNPRQARWCFKTRTLRVFTVEEV